MLVYQFDVISDPLFCNCRLCGSIYRWVLHIVPVSYQFNKNMFQFWKVFRRSVWLPLCDTKNIKISNVLSNISKNSDGFRITVHKTALQFCILSIQDTKMNSQNNSVICISFEYKSLLIFLQVFHGADSDIEWLQRDFSLYIVNMFDTYQASKLLSFSRHSLAYLLKHYCSVEADKQYQLADWRIR